MYLLFVAPLTVFLSSLHFSYVVVAQELASDELLAASAGISLCSDGDDADECALQNRTCILLDETGVNGTSVSVCGPCKTGFIALDPTTLATASDTETDSEILCLPIQDISASEYLESYGSTYRVDPQNTEDSARFNALKASLGLISSNQQTRGFFESSPELALDTSRPTFELGLTVYSADTEEDYGHRAGFIAEQNRAEDPWASLLPSEDVAVDPTSSDDLPLQIDWVDKGAVTEVKDQGRCGCCWATAMVGAIEGAAAANPETKGYLQNLSWQQLISCNDANGGCNGGSLVSALGYSWLNRFGGVARNNEYPFSDYRGSTTESCELESKPLAVTVKEPRIVLDFGAPFDFQERILMMKAALQTAPVAMVIKSSCRTLSNYRKGILNDDGGCACSSSQCLDHAILMVGYDDTTDPPSWKLKNSWGTGWGEDGYFYISQQEKDQWGLFGVLSHGVHAQLATNVTAAVPDDELNEPLAAWAWVLILSACMIACLCFLRACREYMRRDDETEPLG